VSKAAKIWIDYHKAHSKKNTLRSYQSVIDRFCLDSGDFEIQQVTPDDVLTLLNCFTNGNKAYTKRVRYSHLAAFSNFFRNIIDTTLVNPCDTPMIRKLYRERVVSRWEIIEKETVTI
jgi:integrase/recombinase XerD